MQSSIATTLSELNEEKLTAEVNNSLKHKVKASEIVLEMREGMDRLLIAYEQRAISQVEISQASKLYRRMMDLLEQSTEIDDHHYIGKIVLGQAHHDLHDKGITLFADLLEAVGFQVWNLGQSVPPERFVEELKKHDADILCMGAVVSNGLPSMKATVEAVRAAGLSPKILIGGGATVSSLVESVGADFQAQDMVVGARYCVNLVRGEESC